MSEIKKNRRYLYKYQNNGAKSGDFGSKRLENHPKQPFFEGIKDCFLKLAFLY